MDKLIPLMLLGLGAGAAYLAFAGLFKLGRGQSEYWLLGLGVRTRLGAVKVLVVALALFFLSYSSFKRGSLALMLESSISTDAEIHKNLSLQLNKALESVSLYKSQVETLTRDKEDCQNAAARLGAGLASKGDVAGELRAALGIRKKEIASFEGTMNRMREEVNRLQKENEQVSQSYREAQSKVEKLESLVGSLQAANSSLDAKLTRLSSQNEAELKRLREENGKLKGLNRDADRRSSLLRQGLVLREANDWQLEQEIQRLANLLANQPEVNTPQQNDISRALQKINQVLREGSSVTKQAKAADTNPPQQK